MTIRHRAGGAALVLALGAALAGCAPETVPPTAQGTVVIVTEVEYSISLSPTQFRPGPYTFEVHNEGGSTHNLRITGPGIGDAETPNIAPDGTASLTVTLQSGEYDFFCATTGHKEAGMDATVKVP
jgi:uncharacterized cupredoxin-like copper-binding protein